MNNAKTKQYAIDFSEKFNLQLGQSIAIRGTILPTWTNPTDSIANLIHDRMRQIQTAIHLDLLEDVPADVATEVKALYAYEDKCCYSFCNS